MKQRCLIIALGFSCLFISCKNTEEDHKLQEAGIYLADFNITESKKLDYLYDECKRFSSTSDIRVEHTLRGVHRLCKKFYAVADSLGHRGVEASDENHSLSAFAFLDSLYRLTMDSLDVYFADTIPAETIYHPDYRESAHRESPVLISSRMQLDVMVRHHTALEYFHEHMDQEAEGYRDDGAGIATTRFPLAGHQYSFSLNNKFLQQFPYREIIIDSVMMNGERIPWLPEIGSRDIIRVVELHDLKKGKYMVRIGVGRTNFLAHRFQIK